MLRGSKNMLNKTSLRNFLGKLPLAAELDYALRQKNHARKDHYNLSRLGKSLPRAVAQAKPFIEKAPAGKNILFFATLHYWIEQAAYVSLTLAGLGHKVTLLTLPYAEWHKEMDKLTQRQRALHTRDALSPLSSLRYGSGQAFVQHTSLLDLRPAAVLPAVLKADVEEISLWDAQYTLMREEVDLGSAKDRALYDLRMKRNSFAALTALAWMQTHKPDVVLIPNGLILEMGVVFRVARYLDIPAITFEFNDQREQIWLAQDDIVMHQNTDDLWRARSSHGLTPAKRQEIAAFEEARSGGRTYGKGTRSWQDTPAEGAGSIRDRLGLDSRPVVLLATNVLGDSLTLGRNVFASSMAEWIARTVQYFATRPGVQLVVRVHPGERLISGPSMAGVVEGAAPGHPEHIHLIGPREQTNTYDLMNLASCGLAYTTTVGLEMAMRGVPVIVAGQTHFRGRGFTIDPASWDEYFESLDRLLEAPAGHRLGPEQVEAAWHYAHLFFFEYPFDFPWRLMHLWKDVAEWPLARVLSDEGRAVFGRTLGYLAGERIVW